MEKIVIDVLSYILISLGGFLVVTSVVGCYRLPDYFTKMHAITLGDSVGAPLMLIGFSLQSSSFTLGIKIAFLALLLLVINSTSSYILNRIAIKKGLSVDGEDK